MAITALGYDNMYKFFLSKEVILLLILVVIFITLLFFIIFLQNDNISNDESGLHYYNPPSDSNAIFNNAICHSVVAKNATYCREIPQKDIQADCIYESVIFLSLIIEDTAGVKAGLLKKDYIMMPKALMITCYRER
jgi:hypothetical protein